MISPLFSRFVEQKHYPAFSLKAVLFDMDGVLFNSMPAHAEAWVCAMHAVHLPFTHYEAYMNEGRTGHDTINSIFQKELGRSATEEEKQMIYASKTLEFEKAGQTAPIPYANELLQTIKKQGTTIVLVTGSAQESLLESLETYFPDSFSPQRMVTAFDVTHGKPDPEPYLMGLQKAGVHPWEAVVVENAPLGIESAVKAGIFTIAVNTGILEDDVLANAGANLVLPGMKELYEQWNELLRLP